MKTRHRVLLEDGRSMSGLADGSVELVVTSPPYPMVEMWDAPMSAGNPEVTDALAREDGPRAFELMHQQLDAVWRECFRVLRPGGIACINVGDATRKLGDEFRLYSNHSRILRALEEIGFSILPDILWRKQTNAPNKFLGSGMLPAGAYVTYEHEYILIARRGTNRRFVEEAEKKRRRESAYFWEERNLWFSDLWLDLKGSTQPLLDRDTRQRSAAFPYELAYRLIQMHSLIGDTVVDPFLGTGTTIAAALGSGRHSVGFEVDASLEPTIRKVIEGAGSLGRERATRRLHDHLSFVEERLKSGKTCKHHHAHHDFPVMTRQECEIRFTAPDSTREIGPLQFEADCARIEADAPRRSPADLPAQE